MKIKFKKLSENAKIPVRSDSKAAGYDLFCARQTIIAARSRVLVPTDIAWCPPKNFYGKIEGRSGLALNKGIAVLGGVIGENYTGSLGAILYNTTDSPILFNIGDRIAQLVVSRYANFETQEVDELPSSERAEAGFGSTGL